MWWPAAAVTAIAIVGTMVANRAPVAHGVYVPAACGVLAGAVVLAVRRSWPRAAVVAVGVAMAVFAAHRAMVVWAAAQQAERLSVVDLVTEDPPSVPPPYMAVRGVVRGGMRLSEYDVPPGEVPDQSAPPEAVVAVMTPTADATQRTRGTVILVRLAPTEIGPDDAVRTVRGKVTEAPAAARDVLVHIDGTPAEDLHVLLVDTLDMPRPEASLGAWVLAALGLGLALVAAGGPGEGRRRASPPA